MASCKRKAVMLLAPYSQYESSNTSWCWQTSVYMLLLFPEGSCYLLPSVPKPPRSHFSPPIPLRRCAGMHVPHVHSHCSWWEQETPLSLWLLFALGMGHQVPPHEDRPRTKLNSVKCYWPYWQSHWCSMSPKLSPWKTWFAKDLPCEQYNVSPCIGDSVQGTAEIWTSPQLELY